LPRARLSSSHAYLDTALVSIVYVALYLFASWVSDVRPGITLGLTPWNPQAGIMVALLVLFGPRWLPLAAVATIAAQSLIRHVPINSVSMLASVWVAVGYSLTAILMRRWNLTEPVRDTKAGALFAFAAVIGSLLASTGYLTVFLFSSGVSMSDASLGFVRYWVGDLNGVLVLAPLAILISKWREPLRLMHANRLEIAAQVATMGLMLWIIFMLPPAVQLRLFYMLFVPVIWICLRWSVPGAMLSVLAIQAGLVIAAYLSIPTPRFLDIQVLMLTLSLTGLLLGAVVAERTGREAEQRALLAMAPDGVLAVDSTGTIRQVNPAATRLFGVDEKTLGRQNLEKVLPNFRLGAPAGRVALEGVRRDGSGFPAEIAWARLDPPATQGFLVTVRDDTERRRAEENLRERDAALGRAMRFAVAGELASALAHELNQPITALVSYLRASEILASRPAEEEGRLHDTLRKAAKEAMRASVVLRRLRDFYRGGRGNRESIDVAALCESVAHSFQERLRRTDASLTVAVGAEVPKLEADPTQLEIVLHNLLSNGLDSLSQAAPHNRKLQLSATCREQGVELCVEDSGPGIGREVAGKLFEPFVTSKPDGMGLGLAISRSLLLTRGGELLCSRSEKLGGAAFTVRVPLAIPQETALV
jgi:PAS domain S-box-containing protein